MHLGLEAFLGLYVLLWENKHKVDAQSPLSLGHTAMESKYMIFPIEILDKYRILHYSFDKKLPFGQRVQTSCYVMSKFWGSNIQHGIYINNTVLNTSKSLRVYVLNFLTTCGHVRAHTRTCIHTHTNVLFKEMDVLTNFIGILRIIS